jgi:hypothetical protein
LQFKREGGITLSTELGFTVVLEEVEKDPEGEKKLSLLRMAQKVHR